MTSAIIITICTLLLIAYIFDLTSSKTKIPSVILLLLLGWGVRQLSVALDINIPDLSRLLPIFGTIGLILIVLEGSLELELNKSKISVIKKSFIAALLPILAMSFLLAFAFQYFQTGLSLRDALTNAVPFCVISSAIAIPSVKYLSAANREFITYESSLSDIFGVIFFNFIALTELNKSHTALESGLQLLIMIGVSFFATILLAFLLSKIDHHIKFVPIVLLILLIYAIAKLYHLPALIFILIFGLFLGNLDELKRFKWINKLKPDELNVEVHKFKELITEGTFLIRTVFFLLFGYLIETAEIINSDNFLWAAGIVAVALIIRAIQFKITKIPMFPMLFIAPRGLINILLFLSIVPAQQIPLVNKSLILQVVLLSALVMMIGLVATGKKKETLTEETKTDEPVSI
ncbi:MAG: sodium:proton antiporter [Chitinophagaceae bacterium]|nr:sodium:proton antiporter [Chitinophagaceae bacterium]MBL0200479.1 sodium:proton antiporter [Chitinophagaceae bacterium]